MRNIRQIRPLCAQAIGAAGCLAALLLTGCTADEEHREIPAAQTGPVTAYGLTLDENASPEQVAFAVLRSIADDVRAAQSHDREGQKKALRTTHSLLAYTTVEQRLLQTENMARAQKKESLGDQRNEKLYDFARQLAPIVAHYVPGFDADLTAAEAKMRREGKAERGTVHIQYEAAHRPEASDPAERDAVIIGLELVKESGGGKSFWRVARIAFAGRPGGRATGTRTAVPEAVMQAVTAPGS